jgi:hypothetical protein
VTTYYTSRLPAVIDGLVAALRATSGYRDPETAVSGIPVFDGPQYGISGDRVATWLCVGWSGDPDAPEDAGDAAQTIAALGNRQREEIGTIKMRAVSSSGDRDMRARRDAAFAAMGTVEQLCRTTPQLGLDPAWMREAQIADRYRWRQHYDEGAVCELDFTVEYRARI